MKSRFVENVYLYCNRYHPFVLAVIVPNLSYFKHKDFSVENVAENASAVIAVTEDIKVVCKAAALRSFEIPKIVLIENEPWTPDNGLLTPALKIKRPACKEKYEKIMEALTERVEKLTGID